MAVQDLDHTKGLNANDVFRQASFMMLERILAEEVCSEPRAPDPKPKQHRKDDGEEASGPLPLSEL